MKDMEILRNIVRELENNEVVITSEIIDSLFNESEYLNNKPGIDIFKETNKIDEILNHIKTRRSNTTPFHIKSLKFRITSLKEQMKLLNKDPNKFKQLRPEISARLDELESLLEYYQDN